MRKLPQKLQPMKYFYITSIIYWIFVWLKIVAINKVRYERAWYVTDYLKRINGILPNRMLNLNGISTRDCVDELLWTDKVEICRLAIKKIIRFFGLNG